MKNTLRNTLATSALLTAAMLLATPALGTPAVSAKDAPGEAEAAVERDEDQAIAMMEQAVQEAVPGIEIEDGEEFLPGVFGVFGVVEAEDGERFYVVLVTETGRVLGVEEEAWDEEDADWGHEAGERDGHDDDGGEEHGDDEWGEEEWDEEDEAEWAAELEARIAALPEATRDAIDNLIDESEEDLEIIELEEIMDGIFIVVGEGEEGVGMAMVLADGEVVSADYMTFQEMEEEWDDEDWDEEDGKS